MPEFRVDGTLWDHDTTDEIDVMINTERECDAGTFQTMTGRFTDGDGATWYANASWDPVAGQMTAGKWFCNGRTARAFRYVAQWRRSL